MGRFDLRFDLIDYQNRARDTRSARQLYEIWEEVCRCYDRSLIGKYELEEMKAVIWPNLKALAKLQKMLNQAASHQSQMTNTISISQQRIEKKAS